ncbi:hypothetical protein BBP40_005046 [Aspergillus hancockii]|nr:hypothetical protein BBP40_005046 [Aspergillus hancockii]
MFKVKNSTSTLPVPDVDTVCLLKRNTSSDLELPPEGGLRAELVFSKLTIEKTLSHYTASAIAWIFAVQLAVMWIPGPLFGRLIDTYGLNPVLYPCSILCVFALCMTSLATEYYQVFLAQGLAFGSGAGGVFTVSMLCVCQWVVRQRGLAIGIATSGSSVGGVIFPVLLNRIIDDV